MINYLALSAAGKVVIAHDKTKRNSSADLPGNVSLSTAQLAACQAQVGGIAQRPSLTTLKSLLSPTRISPARNVVGSSCYRGMAEANRPWILTFQR